MIEQKVLLVDDDPALRGMLGFSLELSGYQITEVGSRAEALKALQSQSFQVILLDMGMPPHEFTPQEGLAVLEWVRVKDALVKVVVLTGQDSEATSYLALKHGAFDFLEKPISAEAVLNAVKRAFLFYEQAAKLKQQEGVQQLQVEVTLGDGVKAIRNQAEEKLIRQVLADTEFNVHEAARRLGLKRENVYYLIKKYGLQR